MWILRSEANLIKPRFPNSTVLYILLLLLFLPLCPFRLIPPGNLSIGRSNACLPGWLSVSLIRSESRRKAFQASGIDCKLVVVVVGGSGGSNWIETSATGSWKTQTQSGSKVLLQVLVLLVFPCLELLYMVVLLRVSRTGKELLYYTLDINGTRVGNCLKGINVRRILFQYGNTTILGWE